VARLHRRQLITYFVASQQLEGSVDILTGLMPFFDPIINEMAGDLFDPTKFSNRVQELYDWPMNPDVAEELISRLEPAGRVTETVSHDGQTAYVCNKISEDDVSALEATAEKTLREIAELFENFCEEISPLLSVQYERADLEEMLLNWMVAVEGYDREAINKAVESMLSIDIEAIKDGEEDDLENIFVQPNLNKEESYLCARFVSILRKNNIKLFDALVDVASVALLTEVVLDIRNPPDSRRRESDLVVFLDSPILMDALGLSGSALKERAVFLVDSIRSLGARVNVFAHTCGEVHRILWAMFNYPVHERVSLTAGAIRKGEVLEGFARSVMNDVSGQVEAILGVSTFNQSMEAFPNSHHYFSAELYEEFAARVGWISGRLGRQDDAKSVALIMRRRGGRSSRDPLKSKYLMISRNRAFCEFSQRFCRENDVVSPQGFGPLISQRAMAALMMMTMGYQGKREFSRRQVLGSCERVMRLSSSLPKKVREKLNAIRPDLVGQLNALLTQPRSVQILSDKTLNTDQVVTNENVLDLFSSMKKAVEAEAVERTAKEISDIRQGFDEQQRQYLGELEEIHNIIRQREDHISSVEQKDRDMLLAWVRRSDGVRRRLEMLQAFVFGVLTVGIAVAGPLLGFVQDVLIVTVFACASGLLALSGVVPKVPNFFRSIIERKRSRYFHDHVNLSGRKDLLSRYEVNWSTLDLKDLRALKNYENIDLFGKK
jgi:hypothetical protein